MLVVDVQPTFCEGGELGVAGGNRVAADVATYLEAHRNRYLCVISTQDWHVDPGPHFSTEPDFVDSWPPHGVAGSVGAELHPAIAAFPFSDRILKGQYDHGYSGFEGADADGRTLEEILQEWGIETVDVVGLAESHCVKRTAIDATRLGWPTRVLLDLTAAVSPELGDAARVEMLAAGVELVDSADL
ncbi:MAG: isochorismatase family protein [Promicromonosporaceae bacterium]|nr:isochorismatase family protein [Promicromonosporaceae bacterium]